MTHYPRIFYLTIRRKTTNTFHTCRTLAHSSDEAEQRAALFFGPVEVISRGTCNIPLTNEPIYGRGSYMRSPHDHLLPPLALASLVAPA